MNKVLKYVLLDIVKNKFTLFYTICLFAITLGLFTLDENTSKATLSLLNLVLLFVPLVSVMFTTIYYYNSVEFITLILAQPLSRMRIFFSLFTGIAGSLVLAFVIGVGIPVLFMNPDSSALSVLLSGILLTSIFSAIAVLFAVIFRDKARGMGAALLLWIFFSLVFDGLLLMIMFVFADYPQEKLFIVLTFFNPADLARIFVLLQLDISALMGVTGAVFKEFFGNGTGVILTLTMLAVWIAIPVWTAGKLFRVKDF